MLESRVVSSPRWLAEWSEDEEKEPGALYVFAKRAFDLVMATALLPFLALVILGCLPFYLFFDRGPIFFMQLRTGRDGRRFRMFKLRTMVPDAEARKAELAKESELAWPDFKMKSDPRVTFLGRILRKTSLDEVPQLLNVLRGDMSFVGPRPTSFGPETYQAWHTERLDVVPGITGLHQVKGRSDIEFDERVRLDIEYVRTRSFARDLQILWMTVPAVLGKRGAY